MESLYKSNRYYVNTSHLLSINDSTKKIFVVNKDNKLLTIDGGRIYYENVEETLPETILLEHAIMNNDNDEYLYLVKVRKVVVETNDIKLLLDIDVYQTIYLIIRRFIRLILYYDDIYFKKKGTISIKVIKKKHGFIELYICIKNNILGPLMPQEFINGYYDFYIKNIINPHTSIGLNEIKFIRQIEYKRIFKINKIKNKDYININNIDYEIKNNFPLYKDNIIMIEKDMYIRFAYAKLTYKDSLIFTYKNFFPYANFDTIDFFDINLNKIFSIKNEYDFDFSKGAYIYDKKLSAKQKNEIIKNLNIVTYLFYDNINNYGYIKNENYTTNLTFNIVPDLEMLTTEVYDS